MPLFPGEAVLSLLREKGGKQETKLRQDECSAVGCQDQETLGRLHFPERRGNRCRRELRSASAIRRCFGSRMLRSSLTRPRLRCS